jgi:hypothetical protein
MEIETLDLVLDDLLNKIEKQESFLQSFFFISHDFNHISIGQLNHRRRFFSGFIIFYLALEMIKLGFWIYLPEDHWFSITTGSYMFLLKKGGKLIYLAILSVTFQAFVNRIGLFICEKQRDGIAFIIEPMKYIRLHRFIQKDSFDENFRKQFDKLYKACEREWKSLAFITNTFVTVLCIRSVMKIGHVPSFIFGWISHFFQSFSFNIGNSICGFHWKVSLYFLDMKISMLNDKMDNLLRKEVRKNQNLKSDIKVILTDSLCLQETVRKFDKTLKIILFASIAATTPLSTTLVHSLMLGFHEEGWFLQILHMLVLPIFVFVGWSPCYLTTKVYTMSLKLHYKLNSISVRFCSRLDLETRLSLKHHIKSLGSCLKPLGIYSLEGTPYTPAKFFLYLESCILTLLLLMDTLKI